MARRIVTCRGLCILSILIQWGISHAVEPSFPCEKAHTWSETQVCQDAELASLDQKMAELYHSLRPKPPARFHKFKAAQRSWLVKRGQCRVATDQRGCLLQTYLQRIEELKNQGAQAEEDASVPALTPAVVWNQSEAIYRQCTIPDFECVLRLMKSSGASQEARDFLKKEEAWVVEFTEYGNTDLLRLETFRANTHQFYALASQKAGVIHAEGYDFSAQDKERPEVSRVLSAHPHAFFIAKPLFLRHEEGVNGGSRFVFQDEVADCRACEPLATGELVYEFDSAGRLLWVRLAELKAM